MVSVIAGRKKNSLIRQVDAPVYCNCSLNTLKAYVRRGLLPPPDELGNGKFWKSVDLDALKRDYLQAYAGKRGGSIKRIPTKAESTKQEQETAVDPPDNAIGNLHTVEAVSAVASGVPATYSQKEAEVLVRGQILEMARTNKVVAKLFAHIESDSPTVSLKAIETVLNKIVPSLKTVQVQETENPARTERQERTLRALEIIATRMEGKKASLPDGGIVPVEAEYRVIGDA